MKQNKQHNHNINDREARQTNSMFLRLRMKITLISTLLVLAILVIVFSAITMNEYKSKIDFVESTLSEHIDNIVKLPNDSYPTQSGILLSGEESMFPLQNANIARMETLMSSNHVSIANQNENIILDDSLAEKNDNVTELGFNSNFQSAKWIPIILYKIDYEKNCLIPLDTQDAVLTEESLAEADTQYIPMPAGFWRNDESGLCYLKKTTDIGDVIAFTDASTVDSYVSNVRRAFSMVIILTVLVIGGFFWVTSGVIVRPLRESWDRQRRFVADASHELKTPISVIMANCSVILSDKTIDDESKRWTETTLKEAESMKRLIDDMLFLAATDNDFSTSKDTVNLSREAQKTAMHFEARAFEKGNMIEYSDIEPDLMVNISQMNLSRVIAILVDNACKYSNPNTTIEVSAKLKRKHVVLEVSDIGDVIPAEASELIFDRFFRMDESRTGENGYGLGLAMAKDIVEKANGTISAFTDEYNKTTFTVKLPKATEEKIF